MTPEAKVRLAIDQQLAASGWSVQDYRQMSLSAAPESPCGNSL